LLVLALALSACAPGRAGPTPTPTWLVGDLGWGLVLGVVTDGATGNPLAGASVTCRQASYTSPTRCDDEVFTAADGTFLFEPVFFHDTDRVTLEVTAPGYFPGKVVKDSFIQPGLNAAIALAPAGLSGTFTPTPTSPGSSFVPSPGDLGWGSVYGKVLDAVTGNPVSEAVVTCTQISYTGRDPCQGITWTNESGIYAFVPVFFHDTDRITVRVEAEGYPPAEFEKSFFTTATMQADFHLTRSGTVTPMPQLMCTAPACPADWGRLTCGNSQGCPGGCGTICEPFTPTP
jgi:hypothetical protein